MRDLNISSEAFDKELGKFFSKDSEKMTFLAEGKKAVSTDAISLDKVDFENMEIYFNFNDPELLWKLAIRSWYFSEPAYGYELRRLIKTRLRKSTIDFSQRARILPLLESKSMMINYLVEIDDQVSASSWYGNILKSLSTILKKVKVKEKGYVREKKVDRYTGYCRGYRSSPKKESLISKESIENDIFLEKWQMLKTYRERLAQINELATQLWILREFDDYKLIKEELSSISESYQDLKRFFCMTESQVENVIEAEMLHKLEKVKMFNFKTSN